MKIGVISLGCAKNLVDTENLLGILSLGNQEIVQNYEDAEAIIINTCGFIESAKSEAIDTILEAASYKEQGLKKLIVMGCLSQRYKPQLVEELPEVDRFITLNEYKDLGKILSEELGVKIPNTYGKTSRILSGKPWMAYLKIAEGCDNKCSYCAIPGIRGPLNSFPEEELVREARRLASQGVKELNLIAQDSSRYGYDWDHRLHLSSMLKQLDEIEGLRWIRILYLYPDEIPDDLLETIRQSRHILPYFDIPTQHGSSRMLRAMNRRGSREEILERVQMIRNTFENAVLRTTLITGFPGETEEDHQLSLDLLEKIRWDHLGAFTYSKEEDTPSYELEDDVPPEEKDRRLQEIYELQNRIVQEDRQKLLHHSCTILVEGYEGITSMYKGRSEMFAPDGTDGFVRVHSDRNLKPGDMIRAEYIRINGYSMTAEDRGDADD
ncbi:MAG: 30S ribosomal protein S12 methylthiotransferase RimO [Solobacterium sp.]|nr:30S ribosomal protein S12 methylthiotransferase RimO [Solobacterium sp.]